MFALESLASQGETYANSERVKRACQFFLDRQADDGGWGESYKSCETSTWCQHPDGSQVVQTAWVSHLVFWKECPVWTLISKFLSRPSSLSSKPNSRTKNRSRELFDFSCNDSRPMASGCRKALREFSTKAGEF
jgi:squalene cyclase